FTCARFARRVGRGQRDVGLPLEERVDEARLARARRRDDDEEAAPGPAIHARAHSMFWICSRLCSISTFSSTELRVISFATDLEPSVLASRLSSWQRKSRRLPQAPPLSRTRRISPTARVRRESR